MKRVLSRLVDVDETSVGGEEIAVRARQIETESSVVLAAQVDDNGIGRIRTRCIPGASSESLLPFIENVIEPGGIVRTDEWSGYSRLSNLVYRHEANVLRGKGQSASTELLPRVHRVSSLLKRWLLGTHQGAVSAEHRDSFLDDFTSGFNRRTSKSGAKLAYRLIQQAVQVDAMTYGDIVGRLPDV